MVRSASCVVFSSEAYKAAICISRRPCRSNRTVSRTNDPGGPAVLKYFPRELWPTLDPKNYKPSALTNGIEKRTPVRRTAVKKEAGNASGEEDEAAGDRDPDEEAIHEAVDDEFDEDEDDDAGGDYNAEQYFDDGGEDAGDDMDGDDGGGAGDYY